MRKLRIALAFTVLIALAFGVHAPAAQAFHFAQVCEHLEGPDGGGGVSVDLCAVINGQDPFYEQIEGMGKWSHGAFSTKVRVEVDFVRLNRINLDGSVGVVEARETNWSGFNDTTGNRSTDWYDLCTRPDNRIFYTTTRIRVQWVTTPNQSWSPWFTIRSDNRNFDCG